MPSSCAPAGFNPIYVKSEASYRLRFLLLHRPTPKRKFLDLQNAVRHSLKVFGIRLGSVGRAAFEDAVRELVTGGRLLRA